MKNEASDALTDDEEKKILDLVEKTIDYAKKNGVTIYNPDVTPFEAIDLGEPMMGRDARGLLEDLEDKAGVFRTIDTIDYFAIVERACGDDEWSTLVEEDLFEKGFLFEVPKNWVGETNRTLLFVFDKTE